MKKVDLLIKKISNSFDDIQLPSYATSGSSGLDIRAAIEKSIVLNERGDVGFRR